MKINRYMLYAATLMVALFAGTGADARGAKQLTPEIKANLMALKAIRGTPVDPTTFVGRPVLVTFFASWCPPCATEMRGFRDFITENGPDKINIIAVNWIEELTGLSPSRMKRFLRFIDPSIKVVTGTKAVSQDFGTVHTIPAAFIYDKSGRQVFALGGGRGGHGRFYLRRRELEQVLAKMK